ncbi:MAG: hypothetical protein V3T88_05540 [Nitrosomonadaceae bacterium]
MKFNTQHIRVTQGHLAYQLHRDGNVTWETVDSKGEVAITNLIEHATVSAAKALLGSITSAGK